MKKLAVFIDITDRSESIIKKFESENYTVFKESWIEDVQNKCNGSYEKKVLIWHLSSSRINDDLFSLSKRDKAIDLLNVCQFTHKFGVTDNDASYKQRVGERGWFNAVESWSELENRFRDNVEKGLEGKEKIFEILKRHLLHLFLPLDIDMQALSIIQKEVKEEKSILDYLINSKEPEGMLRSQSEYEAKLTEALQSINKVGELKNKEDIRNLLEARKNFLKMLDEMKGKVNNTTSEDTAKAIKDYLDSNGEKFWKNVDSFHEWYCALAGCLRANEK